MTEAKGRRGVARKKKSFGGHRKPIIYKTKKLQEFKMVIMSMKF